MAIVLAAVRRSGRPELRRWVWIGTAARASLLATAIGVVLHLTIDDLTGVRAHADLRPHLPGGRRPAARGWSSGCAHHARSLRTELEGQVRDRHWTAPRWPWRAWPSSPSAREGLETALVPGVDDHRRASGGEVLAGGLIGLAVADRPRRRRLPRQPRRADAAVLPGRPACSSSPSPPGCCARAVQFLQAAGDLGTLNGAAYDLTGFSWLTVADRVGQVPRRHPRLGPAPERRAGRRLPALPGAGADRLLPRPAAPPRPTATAPAAAEIAWRRRRAVTRVRGRGASPKTIASAWAPPGSHHDRQASRQSAHRPHLLHRLHPALARPLAEHLEARPRRRRPGGIRPPGAGGRGRPSARCRAGCRGRGVPSGSAQDDPPGQAAHALLHQLLHPLDHRVDPAEAEHLQGDRRRRRASRHRPPGSVEGLPEQADAVRASRPAQRSAGSCRPACTARSRGG